MTGWIAAVIVAAMICLTITTLRLINAKEDAHLRGLVMSKALNAEAEKLLREFPAVARGEETASEKARRQAREGWGY